MWRNLSFYALALASKMGQTLRAVPQEMMRRSHFWVCEGESGVPERCVPTCVYFRVIQGANISVLYSRLFSLKGKGFQALDRGYKGSQMMLCRVKQARYQRKHTYIILYPWTGQPVVRGNKMVASRSYKEMGWGDTVEWTQGFSFSR